MFSQVCACLFTGGGRLHQMHHGIGHMVEYPPITGQVQYTFSQTSYLRTPG